MKKGSFGAAHVKNVESLGAAKAEKWGGGKGGWMGGGGVVSRGTYPYCPDVLIWEYPPHSQVPTYQPTQHEHSQETANKHILKLGHTNNSKVVKLNSERKQSTDLF